MRTGFLNLVRRIVGVRSGRLNADRPEDLVLRGVNHFAHNFQNTDRDGCPSLEVLDTLIESKELPPQEIRKHLLRCSECFRHYRQELSRRRGGESIPVELSVMSAGSVSSDLRRRPQLVLAFAATLACVLAIAAVFIVLKRNHEQSSERAELNSNQIVAQNPTVESMHLRSTSPSAEVTSPRAPRQTITPPLHARNTSRTPTLKSKATIDLELYDPLRGASGREHPPLSLQATRSELTIKLPDGSPRGKYQVSLADAYVTPLQSKEVITDGVQLRLDLNLSSIKPGKYLLCVSRQTEGPQCVPARIEPPRNRK